MKIKEFTDVMPEHIVIDEMTQHAGDMKCAYGHTPAVLIYFSAQGEAYTQERDTTRDFASMHDELFSATYSRDPRYDWQRWRNEHDNRDNTPHQ